MYALRPLTVIFFPLKRAEAELAESVMNESSLCVSYDRELMLSRMGHLTPVAWTVARQPCPA